MKDNFIKSCRVLCRFISILAIFLLATENCLASNAPASVKIISPVQGQTFHNIPSVKVQFSSNLNPKNTNFVLWQDNQVVRTSLESKQLILRRPDRGTHTLQIKVCNRQGQFLAESQIVTIYVHQYQVKRLRADNNLSSKRLRLLSS